jgi:hypothetical protein
LTLERGTKITIKEISSIIKMRNEYEHNEPNLNYRSWKGDLNTVESFRSKFQSEVELDEERYAIGDLPQMQIDATDYEESLQAIQQQMDAYLETIYSLEQQLKLQRQNDREQFAELERGRLIDEEQNEELERQRKIDSEQTSAISRQELIDQQHYKLIERNSALIQKLLNQNRQRKLKTGFATAASTLAAVLSIAVLIKRR